MANHNPTAEEMRHPAFCWIHHVVEDAKDPNGEQYMRCFECGHLYVTSGDLMADYLKIEAEMARAEPIPVSPLILEDSLRNMLAALDLPPLAPLTEEQKNWRVKSVNDIHFCQHCMHDF